MMVNKRQRQPKGQSRMNNPEKLATQGTLDIRRRPAKQKNTTQKKKDERHRHTKEQG